MSSMCYLVEFLSRRQLGAPSVDEFHVLSLVVPVEKVTRRAVSWWVPCVISWSSCREGNPARRQLMSFMCYLVEFLSRRQHGAPSVDELHVLSRVVPAEKAARRAFSWWVRCVISCSSCREGSTARLQLMSYMCSSLKSSEWQVFSLNQLIYVTAQTTWLLRSFFCPLIDVLESHHDRKVENLSLIHNFIIIVGLL